MHQNQNHSRNTSKLSNLDCYLKSHDKKRYYLSTSCYLNTNSELSNLSTKQSKNFNVLSSYKHLSSLSRFSRTKIQFSNQNCNNIVTIPKLNLNPISQNSDRYLVQKTEMKQSSSLLYEKIFNNSFKKSKHYKKQLNNIEKILRLTQDNVCSNNKNTPKGNEQPTQFKILCSHYNKVIKQKKKIQKKIMFIKSIVDYSYPLIIKTKNKFNSNSDHLYQKSLVSKPFYKVVDSEIKQNESSKHKELNKLLHICSFKKINKN